MEKLSKQDAGKSGSETERDDFNAEEIAEQSSYQDSTEVAQQMRRGGDQTKDEADKSDEVGASKLEDWNQRENKEIKP